MSTTDAEQLKGLREAIARYRSAVIAFSGGVDSTFLARVAADVLGRDKLLLITASSSTYPFFELEESKRLAADLGVRQRVVVSEETEIPGFTQNPPDRCYYCKGELFRLIKEIAAQEDFAAVFDGSNADDIHDHRPGRRALRELGIVSPLCEAGLGKDTIRALSREMGLPTADKPSYACLASRFPYGEEITREKLDRVGMAEQGMRELGLSQFRVRSHGDLARIELAPDEMERGWKMREKLERICRNAGYVYVALDLRGYRTGAMNEVLSAQEREHGSVETQRP
ncbi:MAG: ATP-dependent sacrificial sulfur transferase LarE [Chitinivibrionales bacterium]|nr:ATP-dependent sacrificial sulfur transferase LarE [Chitinivibrionales bacterium]